MDRARGLLLAHRALESHGAIMTFQARLCGCLLNARPDELPGWFEHPQVDLVEWRLDAFIQHNSLEELLAALPAIGSSVRHPILVTNRARKDGGFFSGSEDARLDALQKAVASGADWVDLEDDIAEDLLSPFRQPHVRMLFSHHDFTQTPDSSTLRRLIESMAKKGGQAVKMATLARCAEDNLRVLELIAFGRQELGLDVIAFCMGSLGRWSRVACLLLGSPWTYVQLPGQGSAAPGQLTAAEMHAALELIT
jgi:3-dehydroquinate dehydratase type I